MRIYDMVIVGGGPGGYTAALYAARAGLSVVVLEKLSAGGQMALTSQIDNYPGFVDGIDGFVLAEQMQQMYPQLQITFCVRGGSIVNDATREDAEAVGLPFDLIDSGVAIGGTHLHLISDEAKAHLQAADVIIAKGMGNTESMLGCGYNVYYAFLVKCPRFEEYFGKPMMTPMLVKETGIKE